MNFVMGLSRVRGRYNALWVIFYRLTKLAYFIIIKDTTSIDQLGQMYVKEIVRLYGVPKTIVSN